MRRLLANCLCGFAMLIACGTGFLPEAQANSTRIPARTEALFDACMQRCARNDSLGVLTREGCLKGCAEARRQFPLRDETFRSMARCISALEDIEVNRDLRIEDGYDWCNEHYTHLHKRKGCKDAFKAYWEAATTGNICYGRSGGVAGQPVVRDTPAFNQPPAPAGSVVSTPLAPPRSVAPPARTVKPPQATQAPRSTKPTAMPAKPNQTATPKDAPMPNGERYPGQNAVAPANTAAPAPSGVKATPTAKTGPVLVTPSTILPPKEVSATASPASTPQQTTDQTPELLPVPVPESAPAEAGSAEIVTAPPVEPVSMQPGPVSPEPVHPEPAYAEPVYAEPAYAGTPAPEHAEIDTGASQTTPDPAIPPVASQPPTPPAPAFPTMPPPAAHQPAAAASGPVSPPHGSGRTPDVLQGIGGNTNTPPSYLPLNERSLVNPTPLPPPGS